MPMQYVLTAEEQKLNDLWEKHVRTEFDAHSADNAVGTMVANPLVKLIPVMTGGDGKNEVHQFYAEHFVSQIPADIEIVNVSRTIGQERLVEEMVCRFTHSVEMDWMLPGIAPTGKRVELALLLVVQFDGDKLAHEHAYWDQASVLVQLGLLQPKGLPVGGAECARSLLDRNMPLNKLIRRNKTRSSKPTPVPAKSSALPSPDFNSPWLPFWFSRLW